MKKVLVFLLILLLGFSFSYQGEGKVTTEVDDLIFLCDGMEYYKETRQALKGAEDSILVVMYLFKKHEELSRHPVNVFIKELIEAKERGVKVKVILDESRLFTETKKPINQLAYEALKKGGVDVSYDSPERITHTKLVVVDEYITILGSHNWSLMAMQENNESSVLIKSQAVAQEYLRSFWPGYVFKRKVTRPTFQDVSTMKEKSAQAYLQMAENYYRNRMYEQALREYQKIIKEFPNSKEAVIAKERIREIETKQ